MIEFTLANVIIAKIRKYKIELNFESSLNLYSQKEIEFNVINIFK